jgi:hypothetical protein
MLQVLRWILKHWADIRLFKVTAECRGYEYHDCGTCGHQHALSGPNASSV